MYVEAQLYCIHSYRKQPNLGHYTLPHMRIIAVCAMCGVRVGEGEQGVCVTMLFCNLIADTEIGAVQAGFC